MNWWKAETDMATATEIVNDAYYRLSDNTYYPSKAEWDRQKASWESNWRGRLRFASVSSRREADVAAGLVPMKPAPLSEKAKQALALKALREGEAAERRDVALGRALLRAFGC